MRVQITQKGCYDDAGERIPVGTIIEVKGDAMPASFINKACPVGKVAVTNPAKGAVPEGDGKADDKPAKADAKKAQ